MIEQFKNDFVSELLHLGLSIDIANKAISALAVTMQNYDVTRKESNLVVYDPVSVTQRLIGLYADCKKVEGCSKSFIHSISYILPKVFEYTNTSPTTITSLDIRAFLDTYQNEKNISFSSLNKYRQYINGFFQWLVDEGYLNRVPSKPIKAIRVEKKEREHLNQIELEIIRDATVTLRDKMIIETLYSTGCRASELCGIKISDINFNNATVTLFGKGKKYRKGFLNAKALNAIKNYLANRKEKSEYLYCRRKAPFDKPLAYASVERDIKTIYKKVKDKIHHKLHPHLFRHTTATTALNNGMPVQEIQVMLGHSSINTTMIYADVDKNQLQYDHMKYVI